MCVVGAIFEVFHIYRILNRLSSSYSVACLDGFSIKYILLLNLAFTIWHLDSIIHLQFNDHCAKILSVSRLPNPKSHNLNTKYQPLAKLQFNVFGIQPRTACLILSALNVQGW